MNREDPQLGDPLVQGSGRRALEMPRKNGVEIIVKDDRSIKSLRPYPPPGPPLRGAGEGALEMLQEKMVSR